MRVVANLFARAGSDHLAELEHDNVIGDPEYQPHVVVDQQYGRPSVHNVAKPPTKLFAFFGIETSRGLVQTKDLWP
jgi:hypothetical protein